MLCPKMFDLGNKVTLEVKRHNPKKAHLLLLRVIGTKFEQNPSHRSGDMLRKQNGIAQDV